MTANLGGIAGLAVLIIALFTWLRADMSRLGERMDRLEAGQADLRERMARLEGTVDGLRAAVAGERSRRTTA